MGRMLKGKIKYLGKAFEIQCLLRASCKEASVSAAMTGVWKPFTFIKPKKY
jgi:hypothetical protein